MMLCLEKNGQGFAAYWTFFSMFNDTHTFTQAPMLKEHHFFPYDSRSWTVGLNPAAVANFKGLFPSLSTQLGSAP